MIKRALRRLVILSLLAGWQSQAGSAIVVITHAGVPTPDPAALQKVYTGRLIEIGGVLVLPANARGGPLRAQFLRTFVKQDEDAYQAYWTVRRFIGKGVPPREISTPGEMIGYVESTPGAIGYVEESDLQPGANVLVIRQ